MSQFILVLWFIVALGFTIFNVVRLTLAVERNEPSETITLIAFIQILLLFWAWGSALAFKGF